MAVEPLVFGFEGRVQGLDPRSVQGSALKLQADFGGLSLKAQVSAPAQGNPGGGVALGVKLGQHLLPQFQPDPLQALRLGFVP